MRFKYRTCLMLSLGVSLLLGSLLTAGEPRTTLPPLSENEIPVPYRERTKGLLKSPSLHVVGPAEKFKSDPRVYHWLLDNPDKAGKIWQSLGAQCTDIQRIAPGQFGWADGKGSDVRWHSIVRTAERRVWYASGEVKPGRLLPKVSVQAMVVLNVQTKQSADGVSTIHHQGEIYIRVSNRAARLAAKILGATAPKMAKEYVGQIETFFGALSAYLTSHPKRWEQIARSIR